MSEITNVDQIEALQLLADEIYDEMESESPNDEEWLSRAERFIRVQRKINQMVKEEA